MKFFRTTLPLVALSFVFQTSIALASDNEDPTTAYFTKVVGDNMDLLTPIFEEMQNVAPEEMVIFGSSKNTNPWLDLECSTQEIGKIIVNEGNREIFRAIPHTGAAIELTEDNKAIYEKIVYTQDDLRLKLGKTFGVVPKFKGDADNDPIHRMSILEKLSYLNLE